MAKDTTGKVTVDGEDTGREARIAEFLQSEPVPAPERVEDVAVEQNPPAAPDLPADSADKPSPPGFVDNS